jgi:GNAT superfamily N-acetyltransferase
MPSATEPEVVVRRARPSDALRLGEAHVQAWLDAYRGIVPQDVLDGLSVERRATSWQRLLARSEVATWVVEDGGRMVGFASVGPAEDEGEDPSVTAELLAMYLLEGYWGRGLGRRLMEIVTEEMDKRGFEHALLWVLEANDRARRFYEKGGWVADGARKDHFGDERAFAIRLRLARNGQAWTPV